VDDPDLLRRADELLAMLTTDEKIAMLHQYSPGVPRLGIAPFRTGTEALHGVAWHGVATVFPQAVGLGATWDPELVAAIGAAVGDEVRALHRRDPAVSLNVWAPVVNPLRDPRWGRNEEGYAEDPLLTARMAVAYCSGLRGDHPVYWRTAPLLKHFVAYNNETGRDTTSSVVRQRVLHEYELPPFRAPIQAGVAIGVMPSYNLVNGRPNHVSPYLNPLVRAWTEDELIVCSDAYAPSNLVDTEHYFSDHAESHAAALLAGVDSFTDQGECSGKTTARIAGALSRGLITIADVDRAARRLLLTRLRLGEFDPGADPYAAVAEAALDCAAHRDLARRAARAAVVLLKNDGLLPLASDVRLAVVGPLAETVYEDWYSGMMPYRITVAGGLRDAMDGSGAVTAVRDGADRVSLTAVARPGESGDVELGEFDVFDWGAGTSGDRVITLRSAGNGRFLTVAEDGSVSATAERPNGWVVYETFAVEPAPAAHGEPAPAGPGEPASPPYRLVLLRSTATGRYVALDRSSGELAASADAAGAQALRWLLLRDGAAAAAAAAAAADACVVVLGNDPLINGRETQDRTTLALPAAQERLLRAVVAANPRTALVIMSSYPFAVGWAEAHVPAIAWSCHGGQEAGRGVADVLLGRCEASGRLPQTWYRSDADVPDLLDYDIIGSGRTYLYFAGRPLYPFGHGLSYTTFELSGLRVEPHMVAPDDAAVTVTVDVTNTGGRDGTTVVQVYVRAVAPRRPRPMRALAGFTRVTLAPGETSAVQMPVAAATLAYWDAGAHRLTTDPGDYEIMVGCSSEDIRAAARLTVTGPAPGPRRIHGIDLAAADFDDCRGVTLVDATVQDGDAVAPAGPEPGWIVFRDADLGFLAEPGSVTLRVAREEPGTALAELRLRDSVTGDPVTGDLLAEFRVPSTGGRYAWTEVAAGLVPRPAAAGIGDLCLVLRGAQRVASLRVR
jgi:beta-glucosidase